MAPSCYFEKMNLKFTIFSTKIILSLKYYIIIIIKINLNSKMETLFVLPPPPKKKKRKTKKQRFSARL